MTEQKTINVLLIEDDRKYQVLIQKDLKKGGGEAVIFQSRLAESLAEGIRLLKKESFDVILMDLSLPDSLGGIETIGEVRSEVGDLPVIVLTGLDNENMALEAVAKGAQDYLVKGAIDARLLVRSIAYAIERSQLLIRIRAAQEEHFRSEMMERKRLDSLKDEFISTVSHEIRTPLAIVKGAISNLRDGVLGSLPENQARVIEMAARNIDRLGRIIHDLLDLSRLESGSSRLNRDWIKLGALMAEMVQNFQMQAKERHIVLRAEIESGLPAVYLDGDMVSQVLTNLLSNAIRHSKVEVTVRAKVISPEALTALGIVDETPEGVEKKGEAVQLSVADDGPGVGQQETERLFNKFEQLHRPIGGAGYKGTGLGLAICREIVHLHHGKIWVESIPEQGATFHVVFPPWGEDADFWAAFKRSLGSAEEKNRHLALLVVASENGTPDHALEETFRHKVLRKMDGIYHCPSKGISMILAETDITGAESIRSRIQGVVKGEKIQIGVAIYPDDATDPKRLMGLALEKARKE